MHASKTVKYLCSAALRCKHQITAFIWRILALSVSLKLCLFSFLKFSFFLSFCLSIAAQRLIITEQKPQAVFDCGQDWDTVVNSYSMYLELRWWLVVTKELNIVDVDLFKIWSVSYFPPHHSHVPRSLWSNFHDSRVMRKGEPAFYSELSTKAYLFPLFPIHPSLCTSEYGVAIDFCPTLSRGGSLCSWLLSRWILSLLGIKAGMWPEESYPALIYRKLLQVTWIFLKNEEPWNCLVHRVKRLQCVMFLIVFRKRKLNIKTFQRKQAF